MVLNSVTYYPIFGIPFIVYLGIATLSFIIVTFVFGWLNFKKPGKIQFKWHIRMATIALILAFLHGALGLLAYF
jgi:VIT1/CCC1 family predicted Fe2+/Mn2+ transporter